MMKTPIISVIVLIYNVAPYLRECLDSILHQSYPHLQVIMVDDGSLDESLQIAKEYLSDSRFELVCKENGDLSSARNSGMKKIKGGGSMSLLSIAIIILLLVILRKCFLWL